MAVVPAFRRRSGRNSAPARSYFICGTPRSGTTLLAGLLASTRLVGRAGEFFSSANEPEWAAADYAAFISSCVREHSRNGVFGAKLLWHQSEDFLRKLRFSLGDEASPDREVLEKVFPKPRFLWISRDDLVAQAVSWSKAAQTGEFYVGDPRSTGAAPVFDYEGLRRLVRELERSNESWRGWFDANAIEPHAISYEELTVNVRMTTLQALRFLGFRAPRHVRLTEGTVKQADAVNDAWIARYHELAARRDP